MLRRASAVLLTRPLTDFPLCLFIMIACVNCPLGLHLSGILDCFRDTTVHFKSIANGAVNDKFWKLELLRKDYVNVQP